MLRLFQSNQMATLAGIFCDRAGAPGNPFAPTTVIVQHLGMGQWLKLRLAEHWGIAANVNAVLLARFLWELYGKLNGAARGRGASPFDGERLAFRIMRLLNGAELAPSVSAYLQGGAPLSGESLGDGLGGGLRGGNASGLLDGELLGGGADDLRRYQLSGKLAELFNQYLIYRPDWMRTWRAASGAAGALSGAASASAAETAETGQRRHRHAPRHARRHARRHEEWQRKLWRMILDDLPAAERQLDRVSLHDAMMAAFERGDVDAKLLPERLSVFGLSGMPPMQLAALQAIGGATAVDIYFLNPCEHYWGDIVSAKDKAKRSIRRLLKHAAAPGDEQRPLSDEDYLEVGNPMLSSLGKQGREFSEMLTELDGIVSEEAFTAPDSGTALAAVKRDIISLSFGGEFGTGLTPQAVPLPDKDSLQLHICHSRLREVEVLRDQLLHLLAKRPGLSLSDIIVMVPDISDYAPLVQAVFGGPLRYRISDRSHPEESPLLASFLQLLALPHSRFTAAEVFDLLESAAIARRLNLHADDLALLAHWARDLNIRWELDGAAKAEHWRLPPTEGNTWRFGLDRLLLGFARSARDGLWCGIAAEAISPQETELVGKLALILERLQQCRDEMSGAAPVDGWKELLNRMLDDFFEPREDEVLEVEGIRRALDEIADDAAAGGCDEAITFELFRHLLRARLSRHPSGAAFLSGGITFATMVPMRSIPFKAVCLLGMNDREYPREQPPLSFDLMRDDYRKGDRSRKLDDRYLFLEALLSAQEVFYVSYAGRDSRDNEPKPPSVIVAEWQAYLEALFEDFAPMEHPLQPFSPKHYAGDAYQTFSRAWRGGVGASLSEDGADEAKPGGAGGSKKPGAGGSKKTGADGAKKPGQRMAATLAAAPAFCAEPLGPDAALALNSAEQLSQFLTHSARYFMQQRLNVFFEMEERELADAEPFALDPLERFGLTDSALRALVHGRDLEAWAAAQLAGGEVMPGDLGREQLAPRMAVAERIAAVVARYTGGQDGPREIIGEWADGGARLRYRLGGIYGDSMLDYRAGAIRARHLLAAYLRHLLAGASDAASASGDGLSTLCIGRDGEQAEVRRFRPLAREDCDKRLRELTGLYRKGIRQPLFLAPELCRGFAETLAAGADEAAALAKAAAAWQYELQEARPGTEAADRYWTRLFAAPEALDKTFAANARKVWLPLLDALEDPEPEEQP